MNLSLAMDCLPGITVDVGCCCCVVCVVVVVVVLSCFLFLQMLNAVLVIQQYKLAINSGLSLFVFNPHFRLCMAVKHME